jgi:hypothetical protein
VTTDAELLAIAARAEQQEEDKGYDIGRAATTSPGWGDAPLPRRNGYRSLLPGSWLNREVTLEYDGAGGKAESKRCTLLDWCGAGIIVNLAGARTVIVWDRLVTLELSA